MSAGLADPEAVSVSAWATPETPALPTIHNADRGHGPFRPPAPLGEEGCFVGASDDRSMLGVLAPDHSRSVVVVTDDGELAVAVRDTVPPAIALVRDARPGDAGDIAAACLPWPWMVVGSTPVLPRDVTAVLRARPVLSLWLGPPPADLPADARRFERPAALLEAVTAACRADVGGMRLAPGSGVELHDGTLLRGATLEALVAAHPRPVPLSSRSFRTVSDTLARHVPAWKPERDGRLVTLVPASRFTVSA